MLKKLFVIAFIIIGLGQISFGQKGVSPAKKKLVSQLVGNTADILPIKFFEETVSSTVDKVSAEAVKEIQDNMEKSVDSSQRTDEKKSELKAKIPAFSNRMMEITKNIINTGFDVRNWATKSLEKNYQKQFTVAELQKLNKFFASDDGKSFVAAFNRITSAGLKGEKEPTFTAEEEKKLEDSAKVVGKQTFDKFFDVVIKNAMDDIDKSMKFWGDNMMKKIDKEGTSGSIKKEIDRFVAENLEL
jgi:hypothetical protein